MLRFRMFATSPTPAVGPTLLHSSGETRVEPLRHGHRFILPFRRLDGVRSWAWTGVGFGLFFILFMFGWMAAPLSSGFQDLLQQRLTAGLLQIAFAAAGLPGVAIGFYIVVASLAVMKNRTRCIVDVRNDLVVTREEFLFLSWKRRRRCEEITQLKIESASDAGDSVPEQFKAVANALVADESVEDGNKPRRMPIALGYEREVLLDLAEKLREVLNDQPVPLEAIRTDSLSRIRTDLKRVEILETAGDDAPIEPVKRPEKTRIELQEHDAGIRFDLKPAGLTGPLTLFGAFWTAISGLFVAVSIRDAEQLANPSALLSLGFLTIGVVLIAAGVNYGLRRMSIVTAGDQLLLVTLSPFGRSRQSWSRSQLRQIRMGSTRSSDSDQSFERLLIEEQNGNCTTHLGEYSKEEIEWVAWELSNALQIQANNGFTPRAVVRDAAGGVVPDPGSSIIYDHPAPGVMLISIPARGFRALISQIVTAIVFGVVGGAMATFSLWDNLLPANDGIDVVTYYMVGLFGIGLLAVGFAIALHAFDQAHREYRFEATSDSLAAHRAGLWGVKSMSWTRLGLKSVEIAESGIRINDRALPQLLITGSGGSFTGMVDHPFADLSFVVVAINEFMSLNDGKPLDVSSE